VASPVSSGRVQLAVSTPLADGASSTPPGAAGSVMATSCFGTACTHQPSAREKPVLSNRLDVYQMPAGCSTYQGSENGRFGPALRDASGPHCRQVFHGHDEFIVAFEKESTAPCPRLLLLRPERWAKKKM
jgi:hypothetical protein